MKTPPIFDGHNDVLTLIATGDGGAKAEDFQTGLPGHVDAVKAEVGGFAGGCVLRLMRLK